MNYANNFNNDQLGGEDHWKKYHLYYLIFGSFILTLIIILISNFSIISQIRKFNSEEDSFSFESKTEGYLARLKNEPFPDYVKERIKEEIRKIKKNFFGSTTKEIREEYVEQVMAFPWHQVSPENSNLTEIKKSLDKDHFGMEKVKKAIIEHLAAKKQAGKNLGEVICLAGPAGVGKTSIAESIAKALGRPFKRLSLGGVHNEAEIRGHRNTYVSAKPGIIVQTCQWAKVKNPVISIDEIEKMGESKHEGDPAAAFLEILDPEQNEKFRDHFIELPVDLSQIMFICTANEAEKISGPLRDRMKIIELPSYTRNDKQAIAEKHLIPKLLAKHNLTKEQLTFESLAIQEIIDHYTWEAGTRDLERQLKSIISKFIVKKNEENLPSDKITSTKVKEYLGKPNVPNLDAEVDYDKPGVVNGLSVYNSEIGGSVLPIEVSFPPGKGENIITGNLKTTMEQSVRNAISYVKTYFDVLGIANLNRSNDKDIHINVPKGGIPKDGSSAGVAVATAIASALKNVKIDKGIAMTGEITLHGQINEIGGLKEKIYAASRKGLKAVFIPKKNEKDLDDIPSEVTDKIEIIRVTKYQEIWKRMEDEGWIKT